MTEYLILFVVVLAVNLLLDPGRWTLRFGTLLNLFVVFVWASTRVVSVPELFAPVRMPVEGLDLVATAAEAALVVLLVRLRRFLPPRKRRRRRGAWRGSRKKGVS